MDFFCDRVGLVGVDDAVERNPFSVTKDPFTKVEVKADAEPSMRSSVLGG